MGKGGGGPTQTTSTSNTSNIPEYAQPYVETMLGATQKQLFTMGGQGTPPTYDAEGNQTSPGTPGGTEITGFQPYKSFGGTYDAQGKQIGYDAGKALAGFSPAQQQAQQGIMGLQVPGQYGAATNLTGQAALGSLGAADQAGNLQNQALGYGSAGAQYGDVGQMYGAQGAQQAAQAARQTANQARMYGAQGSQAGQQAAGLSNLYGGMGSQAGQQYAGLSGATGAQGAGIGQSLGQMSTDPNAVQSYMNPYIQASLNPQLAEIQRQYDITGTQQQSGATKSGAFGGSREALMAAENQRNAGLAKNQLIGQGYNTAFQQAQQQMNAANQAALAGNQQALSGYGQAGQQALAGYGMGLQGAGQAGTQAMQGAQAGLQGVGAQQAAGQLGLAGTAQGMQGAGYGLQGAQAGMQGVQGALGAGQYGLSGLGQAGQMAGQLAGIGGQQLAAQQGIYNAQNAVGGQQQQLEQQKINQAIQDYANAQQYPIMQLGTMSNMLRGLPMQAQTTQQYQAQANPITQGIGALGAGASLYNATKAEGGIIKAAKGGIMSYDVGGSIRAKLEDMPDELLKEQLKSSSSNSIKNDIKEILATRNMAGIKQAAQGGVMRFDEGKLASLSPELINSAITMGPDNSGNTFLNSRIAAARTAENKAAARAADEQATKDSVKGFLKNLGDRSAFRRSDSATPAPAPAPTSSKSTMTPEIQSLLSSAIAQSTGGGGGPSPTLPNANTDPNSPNFIPPNLRAPDQTGIKQAGPNLAPAGPAPAPKAPAGPAPDTTTKYPDLMELAEANAKKLGVSLIDPNKDKTVDQLYEEEQARKDKFLGPNPAIARRAEVMKEKTNIADEVKRTQAMRMAEFFAMWGSTPGNTIVAGLNALKNKVPDFIADSKEASKMRREIDKSIADLDQVAYLEKAGDLKGAEAKKLASVTKAQGWAQELSKNTVTVELAKLKEAGDVKLANIKGEYDLKKAGIDRAGQREGTEIAKANEDYRRTQSDINNSRLKTEYVDMMKLAGREITDKTPESARAKIINAQKELAKMEKSFSDNEKRALERLNSTYKKYNYPVDEGKSGKSGASKVINLDKI